MFKISHVVYLLIKGQIKSLSTRHRAEDREGVGCARCFRCYTAKFRFNSHFENNNVQGETGLRGRL